MDAGQSPATFWDQTPRTFTAVLEGVRRRAARDAEDAIARDLVLAWRTANYSAAAQGGKLKGLSHYLDQLKPQNEEAPVMEAVAAFTSLAARGLVTIREIPTERDANGG